MVYADAHAILNAYPPRRIRVTLKNGGVIETPKSQMASASKLHCVLSTDGKTLRRLPWEDILTIEPVTATKSK